MKFLRLGEADRFASQAFNKVDSLLTIIRELATADNPAQQLQRLAQQMEEHFPLNPSDKHRVKRDMGWLEPTLSLKYKAIA